MSSICASGKPTIAIRRTRCATISPSCPYILSSAMPLCPPILPRGVYEAMLGLERYLRQSGLEEALLHLVELRASQINGCAYCIDMR
ncbi:MAG TPA: carboxymuconolactone decarboxylase family protein [Myxococcaceae bacterium]|nr:carboxymuconolactone decarboxylase family protein [Myxococcaceae bacterium]